MATHMEQIKTITMPLHEFNEMKDLIKGYEENTQKLIKSNCIVLLDNHLEHYYAYDPSPFREDKLRQLPFIVKNMKIYGTDNEKEGVLKKIKSDFDNTLGILRETNTRLAEELKALKKKEKNRSLWQRILNR